MKKLMFAALLFSSLAFTACHYGQNEAHETIERNEQYKNDKADYSVNRAGEGGKLESDNKAVEAPADTTAKPEAPASEADHASH